MINIFCAFHMEIYHDTDRENFTYITLHTLLLQLLLLLDPEVTQLSIKTKTIGYITYGHKNNTVIKTFAGTPGNSF